jgi:hypothetical protein
MRFARGVVAAAIVAVASGIAGCSQSPATGSVVGDSYKCLSHTIDGTMLDAATPVGEVTGAAAIMLAEATWDDGSPLTLKDDGWFLAGQTDESVLIMRELSADEAGMGGPPGSDHEVIEVSRLEGASNAPDGWYVTADSMCPLTVDLGDLGVPTVTLDPRHMPDSATTDLQLLVTETDCNSGKTADGRVQLVALRETNDAVTVTIGVEQNSGDQTCQGNPATPYTVHLDAPLGDRDLIDGTRGVALAAP